MNASKIDELIQKCALGILTDDETTELERALSEDDAADARRKLRLALRMDSYLAEAATDVQDNVSIVEIDRRIPFRAWLGIAAAVVFAFVGMFHPWHSHDPGIASLIRIESSMTDFAAGDVFYKGDRLRVEDGLVEMAFRDSGVHLIGTAPLEMTLATDDRLFLHEGEVKLVVPPQGIGFVVETLERKITDLGTSFVVTARKEGSKILVLDGQIAVGDRRGSPAKLMLEGELTHFDRSGEMRQRSHRHSGVPELPLPSMALSANSLRGSLLAFPDGTKTRVRDAIGEQVLPLIRSRFQDKRCLSGLKVLDSIRFTGVAGTYNRFPDVTGLIPYARAYGWLAWYSGRVVAPRAGRYRFWGYADNHLFVAINGKPVFEGSRYESSLREELGVPRFNHPSLPCLNAVAGFASSDWIEVSAEPMRLDILFGELAGSMTSGLLLVEREGETYEESYWGQPKWPLLLTEFPSEPEITELEKLQSHMEQKIMGSFSVSKDALWRVVSDP